MDDKANLETPENISVNLISFLTNISSWWMPTVQSTMVLIILMNRMSLVCGAQALAGSRDFKSAKIPGF